jgi:glycosyltransferase involved in cell wall biosynthesis
MDNQLLFIGGMEYIPNLDSANYLLNDIFPLVQSNIPAVNLDIVGRELWRIKNKKSREGIQFHENVPEVLPYFSRADLLVVPLRYGAGSRIKILEAMASGVPVVTTSKGCEGIEAVHGEHLLVADSPDSYALSVQRLLVDPGLKMTIMQNARHLVETKYAWEKIVGNMEMCYGKITH